MRPVAGCIASPPIRARRPGRAREQPRKASPTAAGARRLQTASGGARARRDSRSREHTALRRASEVREPASAEPEDSLDACLRPPKGAAAAAADRPKAVDRDQLDALAERASSRYTPIAGPRARSGERGALTSTAAAAPPVASRYPRQARRLVGPAPYPEGCGAMATIARRRRSRAARRFHCGRRRLPSGDPKAGRTRPAVPKDGRARQVGARRPIAADRKCSIKHPRCEPMRVHHLARRTPPKGCRSELRCSCATRVQRGASRASQ